MRTPRLPAVDWTDASCRFKWTFSFRRKTKSGFCACAICHCISTGLYELKSVWRHSTPVTPSLIVRRQSINQSINTSIHQSLLHCSSFLILQSSRSAQLAIRCDRRNDQVSDQLEVSRWYTCNVHKAGPSGLLRMYVRDPPGTWMSVCCVCCYVVT